MSVSIRRPRIISDTLLATLQLWNKLTSDNIDTLAAAINSSFPTSQRATLTTADGTYRTLATFSIPFGTTYYVQANVVATRTDGVSAQGAGFRTSVAARYGTLIGNATTDTYRDNANWGVQWSISNGVLTLSVKGDVNSTVNWLAVLEVVSTS